MEEEKKDPSIRIQMQQELDDLVNEWLVDQSISPELVMSLLMDMVKAIGCCRQDSYHRMLGILTEMLVVESKEMFEEVQKLQKE